MNDEIEAEPPEGDRVMDTYDETPSTPAPPHVLLHFDDDDEADVEVAGIIRPSTRHARAAEAAALEATERRALERLYADVMAPCTHAATHSEYVCGKCGITSDIQSP